VGTSLCGGGGKTAGDTGLGSPGDLDLEDSFGAAGRAAAAFRAYFEYLIFGFSTGALCTCSVFGWLCMSFFSVSFGAADLSMFSISTRLVFGCI